MSLLYASGKQRIRSAKRHKTGFFKPYFRTPGGRLQFNATEPRFLR